MAIYHLINHPNHLILLYLSTMITVQEAHQIIESKIRDFGVEQVLLRQSFGRVLRENIYTDRPLPPYHRVTMDGIAIQFEQFKNGKRSFTIEAVAAAGSAQQSLETDGQCMEVMTGAVLPKGLDTVIRYEDLTIENGIATIVIDQLTKAQNIHFKGEDRNVKDLVVPEGTIIGQAEIGIGASVGYHKVWVSQNPSCAIVSTGDELVDIDVVPLAHQIRRSNVYMIAASLEKFGIDGTIKHITDDYELLKNEISSLLDKHDFIILSGGVSKGKFDFLPQVLEELEVQKLFHRISQRPGKPFWFGESKNGTLVFALPGNPVSSFMCNHNYIQPWLKRSLQTIDLDTEYAAISKDIHFKPQLTYYPIVSLSHQTNGQLIAKPVNNNGSGDFASLTNGDGFLELPKGENTYFCGTTYKVIRYRSV